MIVKSLQAAALHIMDQIDAGDPEVSVDEEIFIATVNIIAEGFLLLNPEAIKVDPKQVWCCGGPHVAFQVHCLLVAAGSSYCCGSTLAWCCV